MFVVNLKGAVHTVPDDFVLPAGFKLATDAEINVWFEAQGLDAPEEKKSETEPEKVAVKRMIKK